MAELRPLNVMIAVPSTSGVDAQFMVSLVGLAAKNSYDGLGWGFFNVQGSIIAANRCDLVDAALDNNASHILFIDSDMVFPTDSLYRLLARMQPIVAANYVTKEIPAVPVSTGLDMQRCSSIGKTGLEAVRCVGMGLCLIDTEVFRKIKQPWFHNHFDEKEQTFTAEDWQFCTQAIAAGYEVFLDHDLSQEIGHRGVYEYSWKDCK